MNEPTPQEIISALRKQLEAHLTPEQIAEDIEIATKRYPASNPIRAARQHATDCLSMVFQSNLTAQELDPAIRTILRRLQAKTMLEMLEMLAAGHLKDRIPWPLAILRMADVCGKNFNRENAAVCELVFSLQPKKGPSDASSR